VEREKLINFVIHQISVTDENNRSFMLLAESSERDLTFSKYFDIPVPFKRANAT
jgi:hypothetical protein